MLGFASIVMVIIIIDYDNDDFYEYLPTKYAKQSQPWFAIAYLQLLPK